MLLSTQSVYHRSPHKAESAALKVYDDLLDATAAFDTVDHDHLLLCLEHRFGLWSSWCRLQWFRRF